MLATLPVSIEDEGETHKYEEGKKDKLIKLGERYARLYRCARDARTTVLRC